MIDHDYEKKLSCVLAECDLAARKIRFAIGRLITKHFTEPDIFPYIPDSRCNIAFPDESETVKHLLYYATFTLNYAEYKKFLKKLYSKFERFNKNSLNIRNNIVQVHRDFKTGDIIVQYFLRAWTVSEN